MMQLRNTGSRALLTKLNCLDFLLLKGQSQNKICLCKILWLPLYDAVVFSSVAEPHHFYASPAPGKYFDAAPAPTQLYNKGKFLKRNKAETILFK
jgi:hypothetical protein